MIRRYVLVASSEEDFEQHFQVDFTCVTGPRGIGKSTLVKKVGHLRSIYPAGIARQHVQGTQRGWADTSIEACVRSVFDTVKRMLVIGHVPMLVESFPKNIDQAKMALDRDAAIMVIMPWESTEYADHIARLPETVGREWRKELAAFDEMVSWLRRVAIYSNTVDLGDDESDQKIIDIIECGVDGV